MDKADVGVRESFAVAASADRVWMLLDDVPLIAECIPNAQLQPSEQPGVYSGSIAVKLGPVAVEFQGEATVERWPDEYRGRLAAQGADRFGSRVRAAIAFAVTADGEEASQVSVEGTIEVSGRLAVFARTGGQVLAKNVIRDFATNLQSYTKRLEVQQ